MSIRAGMEPDASKRYWNNKMSMNPKRVSKLMSEHGLIAKGTRRLQTKRLMMRKKTS